MRIGFIGLGNMGSAMAANLIKAGHEVTVYNRSRAKVDALAAEGAQPADSVAETCGGDVVITMLANDEAVEGIGIRRRRNRGLARAGRHPRLLVHHQRGALRTADRGPRRGRPAVRRRAGVRPSRGGAGRETVRRRRGRTRAASSAVEAIFDAFSQRTFVVSEEPKTANLVKLSGNFLIMSVIETLGEAMALVGKAGVDKHQYLDILTSTLFGAPIYKTYGELIAGEQFEPAGFAASLGQKDVRLVLSAAENLQVPMPVASLLRDRFLALLARGGADLDWSAVGALAAWEAGASSPTGR